MGTDIGNIQINYRPIPPIDLYAIENRSLPRGRKSNKKRKAIQRSAFSHAVRKQRPPYRTRRDGESSRAFLPQRESRSRLPHIGPLLLPPVHLCTRLAALADICDSARCRCKNKRRRRAFAATSTRLGSFPSLEFSLEHVVLRPPPPISLYA